MEVQDLMSSIDDADLEVLLSLQSLEGEVDDPLVQMFSSSSCVSNSCNSK